VTDRVRTVCPPRLLGLAGLLGGYALAGGGLWVWAALDGLPAWAAAGAATALAALGGLWVIRKLLRWRMGPCLRHFLLQQPERVSRGETTDVCFLFVDHFEPDYGQADAAQQLERVRRWEAAYGRAIAGRRDSDGRPPQHTWFFPVALNDPCVRPVVASWPGRGWGEIEYHLHHDDRPDMPADQIEAQVRNDLADLRAMGALSGGRYGFVHGMFALAGGDERWCRCQDELDVLLRTGCYADFTFPSLGSPAQPPQINTLYRARSTGGRRPYETGSPVQAGRDGHEEGLLMLGGPMHFGLYPRLCDDAHVEPAHLPHPRRIARWLDCRVHVPGRPNWVFISIHSHTARQDAQDALFGEPMQRLWRALEERFQCRRLWRLHYVTAREAYNIVRAAEAGCDGNAGTFRDFELPPPANRTCRTEERS